MLTLGSLFDGIGGWCLAAQHNGVKPVWSSEIEKFPLAVTRIRFPDVKQLGDIREIDGGKIEPVDIICAGSPCQDLSIANGSGRKGLDGERSGLFAESVRIVRQMQRATGGRYPAFYCWENVPGAYSSNAGNDFRTVLGLLAETDFPNPPGGMWADAGMVECNGRQIAWRTINAEFYGVPQRRRRIFLVCDFRGYRAGEILFIENGVQGNIAEVECRGNNPAGNIENGVGDASEILTFEMHHASEGVRFTGDKINTLNARMGTGGNNVPLIFEPGIASRDGGNIYTDGICPTLRAEPGDNRTAILTYDVTGEVSVRKHDIDTEELKAFLKESLKKCGRSKKEIAKSLNIPQTQVDHYFRTDTYFSVPEAEIWFGLKDLLGIKTDKYDAQITEFIEKDCNYDMQNRIYDAKGLAPTVTNVMAKNITIVNKKTVIRLTPRECERLQGLPDDYTLIDDKTCSDSARYKALGNGMCQNCADFVIRRIVEVTKEDEKC